MLNYCIAILKIIWLMIGVKYKTYILKLKIIIILLYDDKDNRGYIRKSEWRSSTYLNSSFEKKKISSET